MVTVLCANAGMDKTYEVEGFALGAFHHPRRVQTSPGGKGINVARNLRLLGQEVVVTGFAGGSVGQYVVASLRHSRITPSFVKIEEDSRLCINIVDSRGKTQTRLDEVGPLVTPSEVQMLRHTWERLLERSALMIISGSAPRGVPFDLYADLIVSARKRRVPVILDAHDEMLAYGVQAVPTMIKPNLAELGVLMDSELAVPEGVLTACRGLVATGIETVFCSLGARGAIVASAREGDWQADAPTVQVVSNVGCGDATVAAYAAAFLRGLSLPERIRWAMAAGAVCAVTFGPVMSDPKDVARMVSSVVLRRLDPEASAPETVPKLPESP